MNQRTSPSNVVFSGGQLASFKRVVVVRSLEGLGDFLCLVPALRSLRFALPQANITLVGLQKAQALVNRFHQYVDELLAFPGYPGLPEQVPQPQQVSAFIAIAQNQHFDLALQMHGSGIITNPLTVLLGAKHNAGFFLSGQYCPEPDNFLPFLSDESEVRRYLQLMEFLGIPTQGEELEFPLWEEDYQSLGAIEAAHQLHPGRFICVHPGASIAHRRWSAQQFAIVADQLAQQGYQIVLTGSSEEILLTQEVAGLMQAPSINLAGCTSLGALAVLLKDACLLVCNDTGVSHLAAALQVPSVVIFTASDPDRWAPLNRVRHRIVCTATGGKLEDVIGQAQALLQRPAFSNKLSFTVKSVRHKGAWV